jgi:hypothetical protein
VGEQTPPTQKPDWHCDAVVQALPSGCPGVGEQTPPTQKPDRHCDAVAQALPFGCKEAQTPDTQLVPGMQSADVTHCTHVLVAGLQAGVGPEHAVALVAVHCTQALVVVLQAGVAPAQ